jgi:hypothetical protein
MLSNAEDSVYLNPRLEDTYNWLFFKDIILSFHFNFIIGK